MIKKQLIYIFICLIAIQLTACDELSFPAQQLTLDQKITTPYYSLYIPEEWTYKLLESGTLHFENNHNEIGGLYIQPYYLDDGYSLSNLLPNHSEILEEKELDGFVVEAHEFRIATSLPAAQNDATTKEWIHLFLINEKKEIYELFFSTEFVSEKNVLRIAKKMKILN